MKHSESSVKVYTSTDYNLFNMVKGNRSLDMNKIKKILADIERGTNLLMYCPILVIDRDGKLDIVDGQHRYMVAKKVKSPVFYVLASELSLYDIARMNSNTEKWKSKDFINCYCELGNQHYKKLQALLQQYAGLAVTTAVSLLAFGKVGSGGSGSRMEPFQRGELIAACEKEARAILDAAGAFNFSEKYTRSFLQAVVKIRDAGVYPLDNLVERVAADPAALQHQENYKKYLTNLEEIANKGKQKRVAIY